MLVTFDLFSALLDSRTGGSRALGEIAREHGWDVDGERLYELWDAHNKASQRDQRPGTDHWVPFAEHCRRALAQGGAEGLLVYGRSAHGHLPEERADSVHGVDAETVVVFQVEMRGAEFWATWGKKAC